MSVIEIFLPLVIIVAAGFVTTKLRFFSDKFIGDISKFVLYFALPSVIFSGLTQMEMSDIIQPNFMLVYAMAGLSSMAIVILITRGWMKRSWQDSFVNALGSGMPNSAFVGFPVVLSLFEGRYVEAFLMCVLVENLIFIPLCLVLLEFTQSNNTSLKRQLISVAARVGKNPIVLAICVSLVVNIVGLPLPDVLMNSVGSIANTSIALALFVIGGALGQSLKFEQKRRMALVSTVKLVFFPLVALAFMNIWPVQGEIKYALLIFSAAPMLTIYPMLGALYKQQQFCLNTLVATTIASALTLSVVVSMINL
ncbi:AEC family transporter [Vibrio sp. SCSIO 43135]|uniref:AEC family transporter n=1 Tax=Vibrio paucivorans TaxID=2829489 RepID=A0A9X3CH68_9VIBR|nr:MULTISPECIES: AEC family transporter [Vibrio]MCW8335792.1 AEC family transporter [Vibrio paucivorans]USD42669.1 AEC family transporter [Vibrio sp. SCSIO 43135]